MNIAAPMFEHTKMSRKDIFELVDLKIALSGADAAEFRFEAGGISIVRQVARSSFEAWIAPELARIEGAVDAALADANLGPQDVDRVFLTGGSSLVPAVRAIFHRRFDPARIEKAITAVFDLRPGAIVRDLDLLRPIYAQTAAYGHFGRSDLDLPWERLDKVDDLKNSV